MTKHVCNEMVEANKELPNYDEVSVEKDDELGIWVMGGQMGNEGLWCPANYCPFCGKKLADLDEE